MKNHMRLSLLLVASVLLMSKAEAKLVGYCKFLGPHHTDIDDSIKKIIKDSSITKTGTLDNISTDTIFSPKTVSGEAKFFNPRYNSNHYEKVNKVKEFEDDDMLQACMGYSELLDADNVGQCQYNCRIHNNDVRIFVQFDKAES
jgi:hypothetical protein